MVVAVKIGGGKEEDLIMIQNDSARCGDGNDGVGEVDGGWGGGVSEKTNGNMDVIELNASCSDLYG